MPARSAAVSSLLLLSSLFLIPTALGDALPLPRDDTGSRRADPTEARHHHRELLQDSGPLAFIRSMHARVVKSGVLGRGATGAVKGESRTQPSPPGDQALAALDDGGDVIPIEVAGSRREEDVRQKWMSVREEWDRPSCVRLRMRSSQLTQAGAPKGGGTSDEHASPSCPATRFLVVDDPFHDDGSGLMLIKLQRLLALACRTQRTLVLPHGTYNELTRLVDLSPLQAVGHCLLSSQNDWQAEATRLWKGYTKQHLSDLPATPNYHSPARAPAFQSGTALSHVAEILNRDDLGMSAAVAMDAAHALATCTSRHDERSFYAHLRPPKEVLSEVQYFQYYWLHAQDPRAPQSSSTRHTKEYFRKLAKKEHLGKPGMGKFFAVSPALKREDCVELALGHFHASTAYGAVPQHVAATCWPTFDVTLAVQQELLGHPWQPTFVSSEAQQSSWRIDFNLQRTNQSRELGRPPRGLALSYDPTSDMQWERRLEEKRSANELFRQCDAQRKYDPTSVDPGACEAQRASFAPNLDKTALDRGERAVNFWLLAVGKAFLGSSADPQSVAVANIRAAQGAGGALLMWGGAASGVDVSDQPVRHHWTKLKHGPPHVQDSAGDEFWKCERYCYWCGPEQHARC